MPSAATSLVVSVNSVTKLWQLLVGPLLITPNTYAWPNVPLDDWRKRSAVVSGDGFHEKIASVEVDAAEHPLPIWLGYSVAAERQKERLCHCIILHKVKNFCNYITIKTGIIANIFTDFVIQ